MAFEYLIGEKCGDLLITRELLEKSVNRLVGIRKWTIKDRAITTEEALELISEKNVLDGLYSASNLLNPKKNSGLLEKKNKLKDLDIRKMKIGADIFEGFMEEEKVFIVRRQRQYEEDYAIEKAGDYAILRRVVLLEMQLFQLDLKQFSLTPIY